jgi:hypothetical protein
MTRETFTIAAVAFLCIAAAPPLTWESAAGGVTAPQAFAISCSLSTKLAIAPPGATMLFAPRLNSAAVS